MFKDLHARNCQRKAAALSIHKALSRASDPALLCFWQRLSENFSHSR
jgi:hypothetical protein